MYPANGVAESPKYILCVPPSEKASLACDPPAILSAYAGEVVRIPTLLFVESTNKVSVSNATSPVTDPDTEGFVRTGAVSVLFVKVSVSSINETVPVASGNETVLSAVGSITVSVVSCASAVVPSNWILPPAPTYKLVPFNNWN